MGIYQLTDRIIDPMRYPWGTSAFPPFWTPADITTALWLDAADSDTITEVSGAVSQWDDKSGNDRHATQDVSDKRPSITISALNGLDVATFDGIDDGMHGGPFIALQSVCCIAVLKFKSFPESGGAQAIAARKDDTNGRFYVQVDTTDFKFDVGGLPRTTISVTGNTNFNVFRQQVLNDTHSAYINGTLSGSESNDSTAITTVFSIGGLASIAGGSEYGTVTSAFGNVDIAEIVFTSTDSDAQKIEGYLAHKWGLTANLPSEHPYKNFAP